jgi:hypothetical protein
MEIAGFENGMVDINAVVITGVEIVDETKTRAQGPAADVEQSMVRLETDGLQVIQLKLTHSVPHGGAADELTVRAASDAGLVAHLLARVVRIRVVGCL